MLKFALILLNEYNRSIAKSALISEVHDKSV